jgi:DoxX-like protein
MPAAVLLSWATILVELLGGLAVLAGAFVPLASIPMAIVLLVAIFTVHIPNGFSSIKLQSVTAAGAHFGQPGYETDLLYLAGSPRWYWEDRDPSRLISCCGQGGANSRQAYVPSAQSLPINRPAAAERTWSALVRFRPRAPALWRAGSPWRSGLSHVVMTAGAEVESTGALRRRTAAETRVMMRPTGSGSMKVYAMLTSGFWYSR